MTDTKMHWERVETSAVQQRWEYSCQLVEDGESLVPMLNQAGQNRWELVEFLTIDGQIQAVFKRPVRSFAPGLSDHGPSAGAQSPNFRPDRRPR